MIERLANGNLGFTSLAYLAEALNGRSREIQLPSFQRDAVWDEAHIELLWDSLWQGYPVGSLLFADVSGLATNGKLAVRQTQVSHIEAAEQVSQDMSSTRYIIIDGQQRAIAIALGLRAFQDEDSARLWVDLGQDADPLFTVCSIQKPWGRDATGGQIAAAKRALDKDLLSPRGDLQRDVPPLKYTWPTRRKLPVPLAGLLRWLDNSQNGDWREMVPELKRDAPAREDLAAVFDRLRSLRQLQVPLYFVPELTHDQLGQVFQRLNKQGVTMNDQELFFSALKMKWPQAHNLVWEIYGDPQAGHIMRPGEIVHLVVRLVSAAERDVQRLNLGEFERLTEAEADKFAALQTWLTPRPGADSGRLHDCLRRARAALLYDPQNGRDDPGLPPILLARLAWRVWHTLVAWLAENETVTAADRLEMIRYALLDYYFSDSRSSRLTTLPFKLARESPTGFPGFAIYAALWRAGQLDAEIPTVSEFSARFAEATSGIPPGPVIKRERLLGLWTQRAYLQEWFPNFDPTRYGSDKDLPYDLDHILPHAYNNLKGRTRQRRPAPVFWQWRHRVINGPGNLRYWPASLNRSDQHKNLAQKYLLGPAEQETPEKSLLRAYELETVGEVRAASHLDDDHLADWESGANARSPYDWRQLERITSLRQATDARRQYIYTSFYEGLDLTAWQQQLASWLEETIRADVLKQFIEKAQKGNAPGTEFNAISVAEELKLHGHIPAICAALDAPNFWRDSGITLQARNGPPVDTEAQWVLVWENDQNEEEQEG